MLLEAIQVAHAVSGELRPQKLAGVVPGDSINSEDAIAEEVVPLIVEPLPLAEILELSCQYGFDVLGVSGEADSFVEDTHLDGPELGKEDISP